MPEINLAAEVFRVRLVARRRRVLYALTVLALLLVVGAWALPFVLTRRVEDETRRVEADIAAIDARLVERREEMRSILLFRRQLAILQARLDERVGWSRFFTTLEQLAPPDVGFQKLLGTVETARIEAEVSVPHLDAAADLLASLKHAPDFLAPPFTSVESAGFSRSSAEPGKLSLRLRLSVAPSVFRIGAERPGP